MEDKENLTEQTQRQEIDKEKTSVEMISKEDSNLSVKIVSDKKKKLNKKNNQEEDLSEYENLSDDELYAKIQTQKLLQKKKTRKIATMIGMGFAFVLAICLIVLAAVPVSLKPRCMGNGFSSAALYPGNTNGTSFEQGEKGYNEFLKIYDKAFSQSYISAIFSGSLFSYNIEEKSTSVSSVIGPGGSLIQNNTFFVRLRYSQEQTLTYQNGKAYKSNYRNSKWPNGKLTFTDVYFEVSQEKGFQKTNCYVVAKYPDFDKDGNLLENPKEYLVTITVKANTYAIYDNWNELTK